MKEISELILTLIEFIVLGAMATFVLAYAFVWIHPLKDALTTYYEQVISMLPALEKLMGPSKSWVSGVVILTALYGVGSLTNSISSWMLEPLHDADLSGFYSSLKTSQKANADPKSADPKLAATGQVAGLSWWEWLDPRRLLFQRKTTEKIGIYSEVLKDEAEWRTNSKEAAADALGGLVKHIRLSRGTALCAGAIAVVAILKFFGALLVVGSVLTAAKKESRISAAASSGVVREVSTSGSQSAENRGEEICKTPKLYKALIYYKAAAELKRSEMLRFTGDRMIVYVVVVFVGLSLYLAATQGWMAADREYHGLAYYGVRSKAATTTPTTTN